MKPFFSTVFGLCWLAGLTGCRQETVTQPQRRDVIDAVFASGTLMPRDQYTLTAQVEGYLEHKYIQDGDSVRRGQLLFRITDESARANLTSAQANYELARQNAAEQSPQLAALRTQLDAARRKMLTDSVNRNRYAVLLRTQAVSRADFDRAELAYTTSRADYLATQHDLQNLRQSLDNQQQTARAQWIGQQENYRNFTLRSEADGRVLQTQKVPGELVRKGDVLATIGAGPLEVRLFVTEDDVQKVRAGQSVLVELNTQRGTIYPATITRIYASFDTKEQAFRVDAVFKRPPASQLAGTQLQANIIVARQARALVIPKEYITDDNRVRLRDGSERRVQAGIRGDTWVEIRSGLTEQDELVPVIPKAQSV
ncbi:efflux RND transporter periplasmic adaptor subunit [Larkinella sp. VNQ87]|uniref:efflux RND transporter periplasmic adaptor subunit n=1 Tax=Larkinella sp. VNQ87 TaxID=3400921 RepID=UPI003C0CE41A